MKNFTYRSIDEKENLEAILRQRKRKLNRQQLIAGGHLNRDCHPVILVYRSRNLLYRVRRIYTCGCELYPCSIRHVY